MLGIVRHSSFLLLCDQVDLLGYSIMDFVHPCDHDDVYELLNDKSHVAVDDASLALINDMLVTKHRSLFVRMKCTLTSKGRNINIKSAAYRVRTSYSMTVGSCFQK